MQQGKGNGGFALFCCFIALGVSAAIAFITYLLPLINEDIAVGGNVMEILDLAFKIFVLIGLSTGAFAFAFRRGGFVKFLAMLFVLVFVVAIVLDIVGII